MCHFLIKIIQIIKLFLKIIIMKMIHRFIKLKIWILKIIMRIKNLHFLLKKLILQETKMLLFKTEKNKNNNNN